MIHSERNCLYDYKVLVLVLVISSRLSQSEERSCSVVWLDIFWYPLDSEVWGSFDNLPVLG